MIFENEEVGEYSTFFIFKDHLGSSRVLTNVDKSIRGSMDYLSYGELLSNSFGTLLKFTAKNAIMHPALITSALVTTHRRLAASCPPIR